MTVRSRTVGAAFALRLAGVVAMAAGLMSLAPATASAASTSMVVHSAKSGEVDGGRLILRGVGRHVTWVTNGGRTDAVPIARMHERLFSPRTPATGTLHIEGHRGGDELALRLSRPRYRPSRQTVSYRIKRLSRRAPRGGAARASQTARQFDAASLSIIPHEQLTGGGNGGNDCGQGIINQTGYGVQTSGQSKWDTDNWATGVPTNVVPSHSAVPTGSDTRAFWESDGGLWRGCSNTVNWQFVADPNDPNHAAPPTGSFTVIISWPWTQLPTNSCTSSDPQFYCRPSDPPSSYWLLRPVGE
jgi:hypothetical protein